MSAEQQRYSCQIALPGFGNAAQAKLKLARVLIVGAGGLGCPAAQYLAAAGTGTLGIADYDSISISNLHRQILFNPVDVGKPKVMIAVQKLQAQNPGIIIKAHHCRVTTANVLELMQDYDVIIDATDNFEIRYLLNDAAVLQGKPLIYGAIYQYEGQVAVWNVLNADGSRSPNYRDLYPQVNAAQVPDCTDGGVIPTLAGIIGMMQANEAIKLITAVGDVLAGQLLLFNAQTLRSHIIKTGQVSKAKVERLSSPDIPATISVAQLKAAIAAGNMELIDIRGSEEHESFNIGGKHIPAYKLDGLAHTFNPAKIQVLYCTIGRRSAEAADRLRALRPGLNVLSLEGGLKSWR